MGFMRGRFEPVTKRVSIFLVFWLGYARFEMHKNVQFNASANLYLFWSKDQIRVQHKNDEHHITGVLYLGLGSNTKSYNNLTARHKYHVNHLL